MGKCLRCADCCKRFKIHIDTRSEDFFTKSLVEVLKKNFAHRFPMKLKSLEGIEILFQGECEHLKGNKCKIYSKRSKMCSGFLCQKAMKHAKI